MPPPMIATLASVATSGIIEATWEGGNHERDHRRPRDDLLRGLRALPEPRLYAPRRLWRATGADQHRPCKRMDPRREPVHLRRDGRDHPLGAATPRCGADES